MPDNNGRGSEASDARPGSWNRGAEVGARGDGDSAGKPERAGADLEAERRVELERELKVTKQYLQSTIEELKSANDALQSSNEELTTVNEELQNRMIELQLTNDDLHNVLVGIGEAIVIIGMDLRIRCFTQVAEKLLNLFPGDIGRSVSQLDAFVTKHRVEELAARVIQNLVPIEERLLCADRRWYDLRVTPYRTLDHSIKGALVVLAAAEAKQKRPSSRGNARRKRNKR